MSRRDRAAVMVNTHTRAHVPASARHRSDWLSVALPLRSSRCLSTMSAAAGRQAGRGREQPRLLNCRKKKLRSDDAPPKHKLQIENGLRQRGQGEGRSSRQDACYTHC